MRSPGPGTLKFIRTLDLSDTFNRSNFEYSAFSGLKVDSMKRIRKKKRNTKTNKKKNSIQVGVDEHHQTKGECAQKS